MNAEHHLQSMKPSLIRVIQYPIELETKHTNPETMNICKNKPGTFLP
jgi:hypothetical protein